LQISAALDGQNSPRSSGAPSSGSLHSAGGLTPQDGKLTPGGSTGALTPGGRRVSFSVTEDWVSRPPPEVLYEHVGDYFPDHDLDKTIIETAPSGSSSPITNEPALPAPSPASATTTRFRHRKSIRYAAEEGKKALERHKSIKSQSSAAGAAGVARKRSTRFWGAKVEEITPGQSKSGMPSSIPESPTTVAPVKRKFIILFPLKYSDLSTL